ncbi:ankyrin repeat-containing domain protein [Trichoderma chlorosporum]
MDSDSDSDWDSSSSSSSNSNSYSYCSYNPAAVDSEKAWRASEEARVRKLIEEGKPIHPIVLWGAVNWRRPEVVDLLLSAGVDPNLRHAKAKEIATLGEPDWLDREPDRQPYSDGGSSFPLEIAAHTPWDEDQRKASYRMVRSLLRHGADPYAIFASQLDETQELRPLFPGQEITDPEIQWAILDHHLQRTEKFLGPDLDRPGPKWKMLQADFALRSVIHAILEDGGVFQPFLDSPEFMGNLKLEHRDPQGRTLFLSACRCRRGADALLGHQDTTVELKLYREGGPRASLSPDLGPEPSTEAAQPRTAMQALLDLGANPLATDNQGKTALHQLLEAHYGYSSEPPLIHQSLRYLIDRFPSLINQPDHNGMTPIHAALRRMWQYSTGTECRNEDRHPIEDRVLDLIGAGANVHALDNDGNTVIHYLADGFPDDFYGGQRRRQLLYMLLDKHECGPYIKLANKQGLTPIQLMLSYTERKAKGYWRGWGKPGESPPDMPSLDEELFGRFDKLGADWTARDKFERTLLHSVAWTQSFGPRVIWRCKYLIQKGVDPRARDFEGKTARDLVGEYQAWGVSKLLEEAEQAAAQQAAAHGEA